MVCGACVVQGWCLVHVWCMCGLLCKFGTYVVNVWYMFNKCVVHVWCMCGACKIEKVRLAGARANLNFPNLINFRFQFFN